MVTDGPIIISAGLNKVAYMMYDTGVQAVTYEDESGDNYYGIIKLEGIADAPSGRTLCDKLTYNQAIELLTILRGI